MDAWGELEAPAPDSVAVGGTSVRRGSRVRLRPRGRGDVWDAALAGRVGIVERLEQDTDGAVQLVVVAEDDPGRDLGLARMPGHRFFFTPDEVEPLPERRVLVAGIGNIFLGDDGFGCEVARRLASAGLPPACRAVDFGIRGLDLAYALQEGWDAALLVDAAPRGEAPGTLSLIEPELDDGPAGVETHGVDPVQVLRLATVLGGGPPQILLLACEPAHVVDADAGDDLDSRLSPPVQAAVDEAVRLVTSLVSDLSHKRWKGGASR